MIIASENEKIGALYEKKVLRYWLISQNYEHYLNIFRGVTQTSDKKTRKLRIPFTEMEQNSLI